VADVFISYSQRAPEPTVALAATLLERGYSLTYDVNLLPGDVFGAVIMTEIDAAKAVVTIWSEAALTSTWVPAESKRAHDQKKLICVRTDEVDPSRLPIPFNATHAPLYTEVDGIIAKLHKLGCRPSGVADADMAPEDVLARNAARDWRDHVSKTEVLADVEAFYETYRILPMYRRIAQTRIDALRAQARGGAIAPTPAPRIVRPEDVILRVDPGMHTADIVRISLTADDSMLATCSDDKTVRLWRVPDGAPIRTIRPHIGEGDVGKTYACALDPAGRWVAAGGWLSKEGTSEYITIFDTATGAVTARLGPLPNVVRDLAVSPDGRRLAVGLAHYGIRVWTLENNVWSKPFVDADYGSDVYGVAFAPDGRLGTTSYDGDVRLYDPHMRLIARDRAPNGKPFGLAFSPDGQHVAVASRDRASIDIRDAQDLRWLWAANTTGVPRELNCVAWLVDNKIAAGGLCTNGVGEHPVYVWQDGGRGQRSIWPGHYSTIMDVTARSSGGAAIGSSDPAFSFLSTSGERQLWRGPAMGDLRGALRQKFLVSPDGQRLQFALKFDGEPHVFDLRSRKFAPSAKANPDLKPADITRLTVEGWSDRMSPTLTRKSLFSKQTVPLTLEQHETSRCIAIAPDGKSLVLGTDWRIRRFDDQGRVLWKRAVPGVAWGVNLARRGRLLIAAYADGTIRWHRASDGAELLALFIHIPSDAGAQKQWILFTPKGYYDCSPGADSLIGWHLNRGEEEAADFYPAETFASTFKKPAVVDIALNDC
jgi:WD40 repeat protein